MVQRIHPSVATAESLCGALVFLVAGLLLQHRQRILSKPCSGPNASAAVVGVLWYQFSTLKFSSGLKLTFPVSQIGDCRECKRKGNAAAYLWHSVVMNRFLEVQGPAGPVEAVVRLSTLTLPASVTDMLILRPPKLCRTSSARSEAGGVGMERQWLKAQFHKGSASEQCGNGSFR